jgi:energy-coupling factor transport system ATP-binding protein
MGVCKMAYIELNHVSFSYPDAPSAALQDVSLTVEKGQFIVLFGASGSGKSTLLRLLKKEIQPHGKLSGSIRTEAPSTDIGFVFQDPENQVVADQVLHELVFGLENSGLSTNEMRNRVAEMVHFFDAEPLLHRKTHELSGGQKQQMNLASVLLMQPDILLLDEPTAQLDPVSARGFLDMLVRLNEEFGMTIILAEHRLEEVFTVADKIVMMENGQISYEGEPREVLQELWNSPLKAYVPSIPSLFLELGKTGRLPLTVKEGRNLLRNTKNPLVEEVSVSQTELMKMKNVYYQYDKKSPLVLKDVEFSLNQGEIYALLGGNGSGKSTFLKVLCGIFEPQRGKVFFKDQQLKVLKKKEQHLGYLPQNPKLFFIHDTVEAELNATIEKWGITDQDKVDQLLLDLGISHLLKSHPYDLSGGELQKAALACLLIRNPEVLILDEPTKGLDPISKQHLAAILKKLNVNGMTIMMSTHEVEFAAQYATKCGMMFQGAITSEDTPINFFKGNFFYTTMLQRLFRSVPGASVITFEEAVQACSSNEK